MAVTRKALRSWEWSYLPRYWGGPGGACPCYRKAHYLWGTMIEPGSWGM